MKSGYKIFWTDNVLKELAETIEYLHTHFTVVQLEKLSQKTEHIIGLISKNPGLFSKSEQVDIYKVTILKFNTMYYKVYDDSIMILSFFSNRQDPQKRKL